MDRFINKKLLEWKKSRRRKPLILRGARQVGKTYTLKQFGHKHFDNLAVVDLERNTEWHRIFKSDLNARRICTDLEVLLDQKIQPGKTLLFIDEIQACPRAIMSLRYFYEEMPELHIAAAGSLLEFAMSEISFPVGRVQSMDLYPLCFAEYLTATGHSGAAETILAPPEDISDTVHSFLCDELKKYFFIGGMPESVKAYAETGSMKEAFEVQAEICETYKMDFAKYRPLTDTQCLNTVLTTVSQSVGQQIKYSRLADGYSNPTLKKAFNLLSLAKIVRKVPSADPSGLPLGASASPKIFKALMVDIGLMRYLTGMPVDVEYNKVDLLGIYRGAMAEQFVGQEMTPSQNGDIYYWSRSARSSTAEVDFISVQNGEIYPVEVKSGASGKLKSLHLFLQTYKQSKWGIVFSTNRYSEMPDKRIKFIPLYYAYSYTGKGGL